jgi:hypothetical protein
MSDPCVSVIIVRKDKKMNVVKEIKILVEKANEVFEIVLPVKDFNANVAWLKQDGFKVLDLFI